MTATRLPLRGFVTSIAVVVALLAAATPAWGAAWPGGSAVATADDLNVFGTNLSGLTYQPSGTSAPGVLWAVQNSPSMLFRLVWDGTKWTPDTANGWAAGKTLRFPPGTGAPDAEGVTLAGGDANAVYVASERDGGGASKPEVLRYDVSGAAASLDATDELDLTTDLPGLGANAGPEAVTWVPDNVLVAKGFLDETAVATYNPATYPAHGAGLFFVGIEQTGEIRAYALNLATDTFAKVATIASGFTGVMGLEYEPDTTHLWAVCDNNCNGQSKTLDIAQSGVDDGKFVVTNTFDRPAGMANLNNEGFAIAPDAECVAGAKPVFWADDGNTDGHALRAGTLNCAGGGTTPPADTTVDGGSATAKKTQKQKGKRIAIKVTAGGAEDLTAKATGKVKAGKKSYALKPLTGGVAAGSSVTLTLKPAKAKSASAIAKLLADGKAARATITVELTDAVGNAATQNLSVKLKG
ncbi:MAG: hypothetical protein QOG62_363 [Thermoleophilaceae bacterium]|jgi:uncharacterized protein YjiK|nr:hypothetical protein [Thermoleophilaceae bacterium]